MSHYVTRERVHVDRIATAWAIRRFVDAQATFGFVARERDPALLEGTPFDMRGSELSHRNGKVTFEVLLESHRLRDLALARMAAIVRAVDGLASDDERLAVGFGVCEALYAYCGQRPSEEE